MSLPKVTLPFPALKPVHSSAGIESENPVAGFLTTMSSKRQSINLEKFQRRFARPALGGAFCWRGGLSVLLPGPGDVDQRLADVHLVQDELFPADDIHDAGIADPHVGQLAVIPFHAFETQPGGERPGNSGDPEVRVGLAAFDDPGHRAERPRGVHHDHPCGHQQCDHQRDNPTE